jgi:competence protein ComEC
MPAYSGIGGAVYFLYLLPVLLLAFAANRWQPFELGRTPGLLKPRVLYSTLSAMLILGGIIVWHPFSAPQADGRLHIDFLDVGQGDAALVTFPDGRTMLIDGGGKFSYGGRDDDEEDAFEPDIRGIGESVVSEFLWYKGYSHVDFIMASHADADHIQGLTDVAANFSVNSALFGRIAADDPDFGSLASVLERRAVPIEMVNRGDRLIFGDVIVEVLFPFADDSPDALSDNDNSVVVRIVYGSRSFLFTGDIEHPAEAEIVGLGGVLASDLIKTAHHGSRTSSTQAFVDATQAKYAVIPVGRTSPFGHPHPEVVERWIGSGASVMTTGENGTISVSTDGSDLEIRTFLP